MEMDLTNTSLSVLTIIHLILFLIALYEIISSRRTVLTKVLWGLLIFLLPCVGLIIYFLLGRRQR